MMKFQLAETEPLLGIPVSVKAVFDVAGVNTTDGSVLRKDHVAEKDADVVAK